MTGPFAYRVFGLRLRSDLALPELQPDSGGEEPDAVIELGLVAPVGDAPSELSVDADGVATLTIPGVARYRISGGNHIIIEPEPAVPAANARLFLLGSAMGVLLHQRGLMPLHANAIEIDGRAFVFMGRSGAGKSALAAAFHDRGFRVIADDVCVIRFDSGGRAFACPGIPRLRLWEEVLAATGRTSFEYQLSYAGDESFRKFDVPIGYDAPPAAEIPLAAIYCLSVASEFRIRRIEGAEATDAIFANTYRGKFIRPVGNPTAHWSASVNLINTTPVYELGRPRNLAEMSEDLARIVRHGRNIPSD